MGREKAGKIIIFSSSALAAKKSADTAKRDVEWRVE
jgi:hypothetical protein